MEFGVLRQALARDQIRLSAVVKKNRRLSASPAFRPGDRNCSLGQISEAFFQVGGQYPRNV